MDNNEKGAIFDSSKEIKWGGWLNEFLWICAGVNRKVLRQCPTDYAKYAGIGGTILFTALMACLSGGYALSFVFNDMYVGIAFGIFWGLLIFNLDRFIVNTMYSDGKVTISARELKAGLPRIIMAIFLGIVISTPLELRIFEDKIKMQIETEKSDILEGRIERHQSEMKKIEDEITATQQGVGDAYGDYVHTGNKEIDMLTDSIDNNQIKLNSVQKELTNLSYKKKSLDPKSDSYEQQKSAIETKALPLYKKRAAISLKLKKWRSDRAERQGTVSNMQITTATDKRNELQKLKNQKDSINQIIANARTKHQGLTDDEIRQGGSERDKIDLEYNGFNAQLKAFYDIRENDISTNIAAWFIMLLFIIIETAPTFFKMMIASGPYDDLLRAEMHRVRVLSDKRISDVNDEIKVSQQISTANNEERLRAEVEANKEVLAQVAQAQSSLLKFAIEEWEKTERQKIAEDPSKYINGFGKTEVSAPEVKSQKSSKKKNKKQAKTQNQPQSQPQAQPSIQAPTQSQGQSQTASQPEPANNQQAE